VTAEGNVVGLTDYNKILFFDVTTPTAPVGKGLTTTFKTGNEGFAIAGNYAYVPDGDSLKIFNITNLMTPALTARIFTGTGSYGYAAAVSGNFCYVASEAAGVRAIDISNPASPVEAGYYDGVPQSRGVAVNGKYVYVAEKIDGLTVYGNNLVTAVEQYDATTPKAFLLDQNYPNPFNPSTTIEFSVAGIQPVTVKVHDLLGREVATLVNETLNPGTYRTRWEAGANPSGVYFYTVRAGNESMTRRMILMK